MFRDVPECSMFLVLSTALFEMVASHFVEVSEEEMNIMKDNAIPRNAKHATKFGVTFFKGKL